MDDFLKDNYLVQELIENYEKVDIFICLIFTILDIIILISFLYLKSKSKRISFLKHKVIKVFLIDIIIRVLYTRKNYTWNIYKELLLTFMNTSQFYLIISFFDIAIYNKNISNLTKANDKIKRINYSLIFFVLTISYERLTYPSNLVIIISNYRIELKRIIILIESLCILFCLNKLYKDYKGKIQEIGYIIKNEDKQYKISSSIILGAPQSIVFFFVSYYILKVLFLLIKRELILFYANIILIIFKETCKYLMLFICIIIIYVLNEINVEKEKKAIKQNKIYNDEFDIINE